VRRAPPAHVTPKIDIFSMGSLLFTLVTGERFTSSALQSQLLDREPAQDGVSGVNVDATSPASTGTGHGELHMRELMHSCPLNTPAHMRAAHHPVGSNNLTPTAAGGLALSHRPAALVTTDTPSRGNTPGADFDSPASDFRTPTHGHHPSAGDVYASSSSSSMPPSMEAVRRAPSLPMSCSHESLSAVRARGGGGGGGFGIGVSATSPSTPHGAAPRSLVSTPSTPHRGSLSLAQASPASAPTAATPTALPFADNEVHFDAAANVLSISLPLQCMIRRMLSVQPSVRPSSDELHAWARRGISNSAWNTSA